MEYTPLLAPGLNFLTLLQIRGLCVENFQLSKTRNKLMVGLESVVGYFRKENISAEIWIDGSFVTEKIDPKDVDIVLCMQHEQYAKMLPKQRDVISWFTNQSLLGPYGCDHYYFFEYSSGHPDFDKGQIARTYWLGTFGEDRDGFKKGIAVIKI